MARRHRSRRVPSGQEEWQMARSWLNSLGVLPEFHRASYPNASVFDLAQSLRDGVLLCQVANRLRPNSIPDINMKPQMSPFYCLKNIRSFLSACSRDFGLTQEALFDANELFDVSDFAKVIKTLSVLSHTQHAISAGFDPFPPEDSGSHEIQDEDIYSNLEDLALNRDITEEENPYDAVTIEEETKIYEDLVSYQKVPKPERQTSIEEKRKYVVAELLETEKSYVEALSMIQEHFIKRLQSMMSPDDKAKIFINIEDLLRIHTKFVGKLEKGCSNGGLQISPVFLDFRDDLLKYGKYCTKMSEAQSYIDELSRTDPKFREGLEECQRRAKSKFALRSLLVVPFQRVLKYPLLIQELNKQTKSTHPDKKGLEKALAAVQDVAKFINQLKRDDENSRTVKDIEDSLSSEVNINLFSFGHLIKDGELLIKVTDQPPKKRHAFLFDTALIICKTKGDTYHHKQSLFLQYFEIQDMPSNPVKNKFSHSWYMKNYEQERNSCYMSTKTEDMKNKWVNDLTVAMDNVTLRNLDQGNHKFELHTFPSPTYCGVCANLLWGLTNQGYKCAICDAAAHKDCIPKTSACRASPGLHSQFSGTSPFRPNVAASRPFPKQASMPSSLSPDLSKHRKVSAPARMRQGTTNQTLYLATSNFAGIAPGGRPVLSFVVGDEVEVINKNDPEWWEGRSKRTGAVGYFPQSHVTLKATSRYEETTIKEEVHSTPPPSNLNVSLRNFNWFAGKKDRPFATQELNNKSDGTFLIRESVNRSGEYALSVKYRNEVKHIKIPYDEGSFYLTKAIAFASVEELVEYYKANTLGVSFPGLDTKLRYGVNEEQKGKGGIGWAKALYPYSARNPKEISIQKHSKILILNKEGDWWKGECDGQVGYFPSNYVEVLKDTIEQQN
ncbi:proto-oncogene vav-like [Oculina patagonica]